MKLKEWARRCSVGDTCIVNDVTIKCVPDDQDSHCGSCEDCVFKHCWPDKEDWDSYCGEVLQCYRSVSEEAAGVHFRATTGNARDLNPLAEIEWCTLHPCSADTTERSEQ